MPTGYREPPEVDYKSLCKPVEAVLWLADLLTTILDARRSLMVSISTPPNPSYPPSTTSPNQLITHRFAVPFAFASCLGLAARGLQHNVRKVPTYQQNPL